MKKSRSPSHKNTHPPLLEFENVTVMRGKIKVLDSLSVTIEEGENVAILGPNGAGKSSFIKTIARELYPVQSDEPVTFRCRGREVWDVFAMRSHLGIVSNDLQYNFLWDTTGREVILSGFFSSIGLYNRVITNEMEKRTRKISTFLEIDHLLDRHMNEFSSGEARRFLVARALVHKPNTLILDEPTNSLDLHALHAFRQILRKIARAGTGILLVTHNLQDISPECSRVILMKDGKFCRDGTKAAMLTDEIIGGLFSVPLHVREEDGWYYAIGY
ncbi:MAG: ATP-binding cassette domain-containing protein [Methanoregula sp.]|nr:ATP-binding cassette domain-containing protein [Methanoregula sp.]